MLMYNQGTPLTSEELPPPPQAAAIGRATIGLCHPPNTPRAGVILAHHQVSYLVTRKPEGYPGGVVVRSA